MKKLTQILLLALLVLSSTSLLKAQSVRWPNGDEYARHISGDIYTRVPMGAFTYQITKSGEYWEVINGVKAASPMAHYVKQGDRTYYYRGEEAIGYFVPSQGRYVQLEGKSGKEFTLAVLQADGQLLDMNAQLRYKVDTSFSKEALGFLLFF